MKFIFGILLLVASNTWAGTQAECELVEGIFPNSTTSIESLRFETLVDVFSIFNARAISFDFKNTPMRFIRSEFKVDRQTKLMYLMKEEDKTVMSARILLDRTPRQAKLSREFNGIMHLMVENENGTTAEDAEIFIYNFYCYF